MRARRRQFPYWLVEVLSPVVVLVAWGLATQSGSSFYFPPLTEIVSTFRETWLFERMADDVLPSLERLLAGYAIAAVLGVAAGLAIGSSKVARKLAEPIVDFCRAMPPPALIPLAIVLLGVGDTMRIAVIALGSFFPILLSTADGVRAVDPLLLQTSASFRIPRRQRILHIVLPAASPQIMAGMRTAVSVALILMVVSELTASANGIGYFVLLAQRSYAMPEMWAGILLLGILGYLANFAFTLVERRVLRWQRGARAGAA